jgi:hypothetical protein
MIRELFQSDCPGQRASGLTKEHGRSDKAMQRDSVGRFEDGRSGTYLMTLARIKKLLSLANETGQKSEFEVSHEMSSKFFFK